ncbi:15884_t:CDS:1, partial [Racocetra fulgida]
FTVSLANDIGSCAICQASIKSVTDDTSTEDVEVELLEINISSIL